MAVQMGGKELKEGGLKLLDTPGFGITGGVAGEVGSEALGSDQKLGSCWGSEEAQRLPPLKKKQNFQVVTSTCWSQSSFEEQ